MTSLLLFPGSGDQGSCGSEARGEGGSGARGAWFWPGHCRGLPLSLWLPRAHHRLHRGSRSSPVCNPRKFTGCGLSAQSHWRCVSDFFLSFQIFFKQSIFLSTITRKGPVRCVCVLNPWPRGGSLSPSLEMRGTPTRWSPAQLRGQAPCPPALGPSREGGVPAGWGLELWERSPCKGCPVPPWEDMRDAGQTAADRPFALCAVCLGFLRFNKPFGKGQSLFPSILTTSEGAGLGSMGSRGCGGMGCCLRRPGPSGLKGSLGERGTPKRVCMGGA